MAPEVFRAMTLVRALAIGVDSPHSVVEFPIEHLFLRTKRDVAATKERRVPDLPFHVAAIAGCDMGRAADVTRRAMPKLHADPLVLTNCLGHPFSRPTDRSCAGRRESAGDVQCEDRAERYQGHPPHRTATVPGRGTVTHDGSSRRGPHDQTRLGRTPRARGRGSWRLPTPDRGPGPSRVPRALPRRRGCASSVWPGPGGGEHGQALGNVAGACRESFRPQSELNGLGSL